MKYLYILGVLLALSLVACQPIQPEAATAQQGATTQMTDEEKIANAMSAAPMMIAKDAAVRDWPAEPGGEAKELRAGANGWVCRPDDPVTISNDPRCFDPAWQKIFGKEFGAEREANTMPGVAYMLQGGSVADNDDPTILEPAAGQEWQIDLPHVMLALPVPWDQTLFSTDHHSGGPWVMFNGSPNEHLMVPIPEESD
jgi:hypothetical protein